MDAGQITLESMNLALWYNQWLVKKIRPYLRGEILEVGCGIGNFTKMLENYGQVTAIDIVPKYYQLIKKNSGQKTLVGLGDIEKGEYFFKHKKFDVVVCLNVLEHIKQDAQALENIYKLLKVNGFLILLVPGHQSLYGEIDKAIDHFRRYNKSNLKTDLERLGFNVIKIRRLNFLGALGWFISSRILKNNIVQEEKIKLFNLIAPIALPIEDIIEPPLGISVLAIARRDL